MAALRSVATESPSGRLVIDISRLRETVATNPDTEMTAISSGLASRGADGHDSVAKAPAASQPFPRISLSLTGSDRAKKRVKVIAVVVAAVLLVGITLAVRSRFAAAPAADPLWGPARVDSRPNSAASPHLPSPTMEPKKPVSQEEGRSTFAISNALSRNIRKSNFMARADKTFQVGNATSATALTIIAGPAFESRDTR